MSNKSGLLISGLVKLCDTTLLTFEWYRVLIAVLRFTVGQRTISGRLDHVTDHSAPWSDKMAGRKRGSCLSESTSSDGAPASKRRMLLAKSVDKWIAEYDKELNTSTWLKYTVVDRHHVDSLTCSVCT